MPGDDSTAWTLVEFTKTLADHQSVEGVFGALGDYCKRLLDVDGIGVLLLDDGDLTVATTNSPRGRVAERLEASLAEGPCTDCVRTGQHLSVPDLEAEQSRWPNFAPPALEAGIRGIHAIPVSARSDLVGAVDVVMTEARELTPDELATALMLTEVATSYLLSIRAHEEADALAVQLQHALDSRVVIEQAKGMLAERHDVDLTDAFERMRAYARSENQRLRDVATGVTNGTLDLD
ncbi:GAF and ANTAR domain-containing protein [Salsipaludibacter albus]|uniref:GAF and ANTAR domain-containing protein n=1 Tax=Salsipaludibacter albus TaxID=2849650 RepID=UPI001EE3A340|nr:GAF and ANTAR domain-containing protein [Salsipaludibacter albus]MBY5162865.1 GAF and ANTAR domain-containing protein [Salsipaludibacter albus]